MHAIHACQISTIRSSFNVRFMNKLGVILLDFLSRQHLYPLITSLKAFPTSSCTFLWPTLHETHKYTHTHTLTHTHLPSRLQSPGNRKGWCAHLPKSLPAAGGRLQLKGELQAQRAKRASNESSCNILMYQADQFQFVN
jgi:hypothetical protein